jgi:hypothetical protein
MSGMNKNYKLAIFDPIAIGWSIAERKSLLTVL